MHSNRSFRLEGVYWYTHDKRIIQANSRIGFVIMFSKINEFTDFNFRQPIIKELRKNTFVKIHFSYWLFNSNSKHITHCLIIFKAEIVDIPDVPLYFVENVYNIIQLQLVPGSRGNVRQFIWILILSNNPYKFQKDKFQFELCCGAKVLNSC